MSPFYKTQIGGGQETFELTQWQQIIGARTADEHQKRRLLEQLIARYWKPVYCYLRRKGMDNEKAKDLTQAFFQEVVLGRELIEQADPQKGRFRNFLLASLERFVTDAVRHDLAKKRSPSGHLRSLDMENAEEIAAHQDDLDPAQAFNCTWAAELLTNVIDRVQSDLQAVGKQTHWDVFHRRCLLPVEQDSSPPDLNSLCAEFGIASESQISNMIVTVKRRLRKALQQQLAEMAGTETKLEEELPAILTQITGKGGKS